MLFQIWSTTSWSINISNNTFENNHQGIAIATALTNGTPLYIPSGSISNNTFTNSGDFDIAAEHWPLDGAGNGAVNEVY